MLIQMRLGFEHVLRRRGASYMLLLGLVLNLSYGCGSKSYLMPTPNIYTHADWDPFADVPQVLQGADVSVLYFTDRVPTKQAPTHVEYGYERSRSAAFGEAVVRIGKNKSWDEIVQSSRTHKRSSKLELAVTSTRELARFEKTPPSLIATNKEMASGKPPQATQTQLDAERKFMEDLSERLAKTPQKEIFMYVHGFENTFDDGVLTTAELWHFLGREGVPVSYSWPSGIGLRKAYDYTRDSTEFTAYHLKQALRLIASHPEVEKVHILAHSRGTAVLTNAIRELHLELRSTTDTRTALKLGTVVLAAADIDLDVMIQRNVTERIGQAIEYIAIYTSQHDKALGFSSWLVGGAKRFGQFDSKMFDADEIRALRASRRLQMIDVRVNDV